MLLPSHRDRNHLFYVNPSRFERRKCWWRDIREIWPFQCNSAAAISRGIDSKLMFPWSDCKIFWIFLLGAMYRTRPVLNRVNPGSRKIRRPTAPIQNPSFSADHRGRLRHFLTRQMGRMASPGSRQHRPQHRRVSNRGPGESTPPRCTVTCAR